MLKNTHISAIICEYNPFHLGHKYHIDETRKAGATHIIAIMSGNFVQRGDVSIVSKWAKTKMALSAGVDLVIDLPTIFSLTGAEKFAQSGVFIANSLGCVESLSFGSEDGNVSSLKKAAQAISSVDIRECLLEKLKEGITFAKAREEAVLKIFGKEVSNVLKTPNNILAVEYIKAIDDLNSKIKPITVKRIGSGHDSFDFSQKLISASMIRNFINLKDDQVYNFIPEPVVNILKDEIKSKASPAKIFYAQRVILSKLRTMTRGDFAKIQDVSEGLENRIFDAVRNSNNIENLYQNIKTKRYTHARIRRIILSAFLGITNEQKKINPSYIKILGFNKKGREILNLAKDKKSIPIISRAADISLLSDTAKNIFDTECKFSDLYSVFMPKIGNCGLEMTNGIVKI